MGLETAAILGLGGALGGGIAGAFAGDKKVITQRRLGPLAAASPTERLGGQLEGNIPLLQQFADAGPGIAQIRQAFAEQLGLAPQLAAFAGQQQTFQSQQRQLQQQLQGLAGGQGFLPTQQDISRTRGISEQLFAPEQVALRQRFEEQERQARISAQGLGRRLDDPILRAKLAQEQTRQQERLQAQIGARGQELALLQPRERLQLGQAALQIGAGALQTGQQRLQTLGSRAGIFGGLATQALQNRLRLVELGGQIGARERNFRIQEAGGDTTQITPGPGPFLGALVGAGGGAQAGASLAGFFGGGGGTSNFTNQAQAQLASTQFPSVSFGQSARQGFGTTIIG